MLVRLVSPADAQRSRGQMGGGLIEALFSSPGDAPRAAPGYRGGEARYAPPPLLKRMVMAGQLGRKSGKGFYEYAPAAK